MKASFIVVLYKKQHPQGKEVFIRCDGPIDDPREANDYGLREAGKNRCYYNVLPLSPVIPEPMPLEG